MLAWSNVVALNHRSVTSDFESCVATAEPWTLTSISEVDALKSFENGMAASLFRFVINIYSNSYSYTRQYESENVSTANSDMSLRYIISIGKRHHLYHDVNPFHRFISTIQIQLQLHSLFSILQP